MNSAGDHSMGTSPYGRVEVDDGLASTSDFVKKLYNMLEDPSFRNIVCWGPHGDCFIVRDMNEFTKSILPRMFKHSNFASFVRQLNKYDFHKVKNTEDTAYGEHSWTFKHPDFHANRRDALENIKRKVPATRKSTAQPIASSSTMLAQQPHQSSPSPYSNFYPPPPSPSDYQVDALQSQVERLTRSHEEMSAHIRNLERNYHDVLVEMVGFQRNMAQQDGLMQNLIQYLLQSENGKRRRPNNGSLPSSSPSGLLSAGNPFVPTQEAQRLFNDSSLAMPMDMGRSSLLSLSEVSRRAQGGAPPSGLSPFNFPHVNGSLGPAPRRESDIGRGASIASRQDALQQIEELQKMRMGSSTAASKITDGLAALRAKSRSMPTQASAPILSSPAESLGNAFNFPYLPPTDYSFKFDPSAFQEGKMGAPSTSAAMDPSNSAIATSMPSNPAPVTSLQSQPSSGNMDLFQEAERFNGLEVYTVGSLMPRSTTDDTNGNYSFDMNALGTDNSYGGSNVASSSSTVPSSQQTLRVRRSTYVPGWATTPRVLLVDDDAVTRKLSSKFLQVFGCTIDVAVDGVGAVNKMNLEKYDLVLMDIVMPKLDGISATSMIRKFDHMTPIISMTSNSNPNEIMTYYSSGMNDILPKPFTKQGMFDMLEKHLTHLKTIAQMSRAGSFVQRPIGAPDRSPTYANSPESLALTQVPNWDASVFGADQSEGTINPLVGMGITDDQYSLILQNMMSKEDFLLQSDNSPMAENFSSGTKRELSSPDELNDERQGKRGRFEEVLD